jgi:hypothetical protein
MSSRDRSTIWSGVVSGVIRASLNDATAPFSYR